MHCPNCGNKISGSEKFCPDCGHKIEVEIENKETNKTEDTTTNPSSKSRPTKERRPSDGALTKLQKRYKDTGNTSVALSILGIVLSFGLSLADYSLDETVIGVIIFLPLIAPFYYFGKKLKDKGTDDLSYALKVSKGMLIYTAVFIVINLLMGGIGWLWFFVLYYFYKTYKETKDFLEK